MITMENKKIYYLKDIAVVLGLTPGAVRMRLHRGDVENGNFPAPFRLGGPGCRLSWRPQDVDLFLEQKALEVRVVAPAVASKIKTQTPKDISPPPRRRGRPKKSDSVAVRRGGTYAIA